MGHLKIGTFKNWDSTIFVLDRKNYRQPDRQTDRQTDIPTDLQTDRQTDLQTDRQTDRQQTDIVVHREVQKLKIGFPKLLTI